MKLRSLKKISSVIVIGWLALFPVINEVRADSIVRQNNIRVKYNLKPLKRLDPKPFMIGMRAKKVDDRFNNGWYRGHRSWEDYLNFKYKRAGENLCWKQQEEYNCTLNYLISPTHKANLLGDYDYIVEQREGDKYVHWYIKL